MNLEVQSVHTTPEKSCERTTLTDVIFFDLDSTEGQTTLGKASHPPSPLPSRHPSLRPSLRAPGQAYDSLSVSILTFAGSDAVELQRKLENSLAMCQRSKHKTEIIVGCEDGNTPLLQVATAYAAQGVRVLSLP